MAANGYQCSIGNFIYGRASSTSALPQIESTTSKPSLAAATAPNATASTTFSAPQATTSTPFSNWFPKKK